MTPAPIEHGMFGEAANGRANATRGAFALSA